MSDFVCYKIADSIFKIGLSEDSLKGFENLNPFKYQPSELDDIKFTLSFNQNIPAGGILLYTSDEYFFSIIEVADGYRVDISDINTKQKFGLYFNNEYKTFVTDMSENNISQYVLNNMLMLSYTFATIGIGALMIHASVAVVDGRGYLFLGKSGTGKSTHCRLWLKNIEGADILNDDNPILKVESDGVYVYGSAWSGKGCVYKNEKYPVGGIVRLSQAPYNKIERKSGVHAFGLIYTSCSKLPWNSNFMSQICSILGKVVSTVPIYYMECLPDDAAAILSYDTVSSIFLK